MATSGPDAAARALELDQKLAALGSRLDLLLYVTPTDADAAFERFRASGFTTQPEFRYRPLELDVAGLRQRLSELKAPQDAHPFCRILQREPEFFRSKLELLAARGTPRFLELSRQVYGSVDATLSAAASTIREATAGAVDDVRDGFITATEFAARASSELERYRRVHASLQARVELRDDVSSLIVARGNLLIPRGARFAQSRIEGLLQHELGTHLVTYCNGGVQPLKMLQAGLFCHEELQEGLAVFAEFLSGELSPYRLRLLAARVVAIAGLLEGADFAEVFQQLMRDFGMAERAAFATTMRTFRGGGLTKDALYLRGLERVRLHVASGGALSPLLLGKFGFHHLPFVIQAAEAGLLEAPLLMPHYAEDDAAAARWARARTSTSVLDLLVIQRHAA